MNICPNNALAPRGIIVFLGQDRPALTIVIPMQKKLVYKRNNLVRTDEKASPGRRQIGPTHPRYLLNQCTTSTICTFY